MKKSLFPILTSIASAALLSACLFQGSEPDPKASARFEFSVTPATAGLAKGSASTSLTLGDSTGLQVRLDEAGLIVRRIKLESDDETLGRACDTTKALKKQGDSSETEIETEAETESERECEDHSEFSIVGPFHIDMLTGISTPEIGRVTVPTGHYDRVKIELEHAGATDSSAMEGSTLLAKGMITSGAAAGIPFKLSLRFRENLKIENAAGLQLDGSTLHTILVQVLAGDWLHGLNLEQCLPILDSTALADGIVISEDTELGKCLDAEHLLKDNFRASFHAKHKEAQEKDGQEKAESDSTGHSGSVK